MKTNNVPDYVRLPFEYATDAELILCANHCGIGESSIAHLAQGVGLTRTGRPLVIKYIRGGGYESIQVDLNNRVTDPDALVPYELCQPKEEEPNLEARHSPDRKAAIAFLKAIGLVGARYVRKGSFDSPQALYECDWQSARKLIEEITITTDGSATVNGCVLTLHKANAPSWNASRYVLKVYDANAKDALGHIEITSYIGCESCHIEFTNYAA